MILTNSDIPISSWADEIDDGDSNSLPKPFDKIFGNTKTTTSFYQNDDGKKVKIVRTYRIDKKLVSSSIARRKGLSKFGNSKTDSPGPNPATTVTAEETFMQFVANKEESEKDVETSALDKLKSSNKGVVKCRICKEDHWTTRCPYKETLGPLRDSLTGVKDGNEDDSEQGEKSSSTNPTTMSCGSGAPGSLGTSSVGRYIPPSRREGATARPFGSGDTMNSDRRRNEDTAAIRVSNLSESTQEGDLQDLFKPFGSIARIFLAKDKLTGQCKGFAFINYHKKEEAAKAIATLNGYGYDHLILNVEWAKPTTN